ncbi:hypothetical protein QVD17_08469 [Tagetes erecta]|uniref:Uncharacterized protein n=1 Tax=Tagetes erecta TaxID=13708 RepID=A0AAD8L2Y5_TARER|nr:hypothetical protein QVD17_08469 [Tagetes erecta]
MKATMLPGDEESKPDERKATVLPDDDEYNARHAEDEDDSEDDGDNDGDSDDEEDDDNEDDGGNDDGGDDAESDSEEAEIIETAEPMDLETENVGVVEQSMIEEPVEVASVEEEVVTEVPKEVMAEAETIAQIVDEVDAGVTDPIPVDIPTTSSQVAEKIEQVLESSPKVVSSVDETENEKKIAELEEMAEGTRKLDAVPEITGDEGCSKKAKLDETVQIEPIQSVAVVEMAEIAKDVEKNVTNAEVDK